MTGSTTVIVFSVKSRETNRKASIFPQIEAFSIGALGG
jgi:hypothetical protein